MIYLPSTVEMLPSADLILTNARVLTMDCRHPEAQALAVQRDTIVAVGSTSQVTRLREDKTRVIDCQGLTLLPGLVDAHCHLLALAASLTGVDCRPERVTSIEELKQEVGLWAERTPPGSWVRGYGYDERSLAEGRHPTRWDLDAAAPHHPVRLDHRSGHAVVLNTRGLELAGVHRETPDPVEGVIYRDGATGEPSGVLFEMSGFLRRRLGGTREQAEFDQGIAGLNTRLLEYGITSVHDAGPNNDLDRWSTFKGLKDAGRLAPRVTMMAGAAHLDEMVAAGLRWGAGDHHLRLGHVKIMLTMTTGSLQPGIPELREMVSHTHQAGFPVAVHAVEAAAAAAAAQVIHEEKTSLPGSRDPNRRSTATDRIEHCSECPPELVEQVKTSGALVVTQPGFIYWNGERYLSSVAPDMLPHLYPTGRLAESGAPLAFGSDAPVIDPNPWPGIYAAMTRTTKSGKLLPGEGNGVPVLEALRMYTIQGARAEGTQACKGSIRAGKLADLVLVDNDPTRVPPSDLKDIKAVLTIIGGQVVWERGNTPHLSPLPQGERKLFSV